MGNSSNKFRRYLQNGDEYAALETFNNSLELQHNLDPNSSYGDSFKHNTPLHLAAHHAMKPLIRIFLHQLKGNPNKQNVDGETALHLVCQGDLARNSSNQDRRASCLNMILQWKNFPDNEQKIDLSCVDLEGNTALHNAAANGLQQCVKMLVSHGAPLFILNKSAETVCDLAEKNKHEDIAQFLEAKMLFFEEETSSTIHPSAEEVVEEDVRGLRAQDLQEAKDQLLVETSDMFHVPLFTAEGLLRNHEWSRQSLLDAWMKDPVACCKEAGISPPSSALNFSSTQESLKMCCEQIQNEYQNGTLNSPARTVTVKDEVMCDICTMSIQEESDLIQVPCSHQFCKNCWKVYLTAKILDGEAHSILCPAFQCPHMVPTDVIERLVSSDMVKRYLQFDIKAFVESNPTMKWCPYPGCARAVKLPEFERVNEEIMAISFTNPPSLSHAVDCGNKHYFCWYFEEPFAKSIPDKVTALTATLSSFSTCSFDMSFLEEAMYELLRSRRILCGAYVYGFYLEDNGYNKTIFEYLQNDLEEVTEKLSDTVARTYLQTPQCKIIQMTAQVKRKRLDLLNAVQKGLIPPETPPSMRKNRKRRLPGLMGMDPIDDPLLSQAILESLDTVDPNDPWVIDPQGKHTNIAAVCDWPDDDSDEEENQKSSASSAFGICSREGCSRYRAKNCRTGEIHDYCSLSCKHWEEIKSPASKASVAHIDPAMDLLIALEISKLQSQESNLKTAVETESTLCVGDMLCSNASLGNVAADESNDVARSSEELEPIAENSLPESLTSKSSDASDVTDVMEPKDLLPEKPDHFPFSYSNGPQQTTINFYLKNNSDEDTKNVNMKSDSSSSKTEKELFAVQRTGDVSDISVENDAS
ncbi:ankyrin repeat and IBR domain-containing protein 1-like [Uloborus diversus]|uniref:ankyrin repeat and IBR domain-containing protein 1-like n=1 Tax=Uloborus diversus TaxID=327109 RepID=UPI0024098612|nr:ankyrin repeat and IBR domain-containing protein 1-like [Uloborus diversus]